MSNKTARIGASSFVSSELKSAIQTLEPTLTSYKSTIDALCADIVAVERFLEERLVLIDVDMRTNITPANEDDECKGQYYRLRWCETKSGKFRLLCTLERNDGDEHWATLINTFALAEAPLYLRVSLAAQLPAFLKVVDQELRRWQSAYLVSVGLEPPLEYFQNGPGF